MRVMITGSTGFLGMHLRREFGRHHETFALLRQPGGPHVVHDPKLKEFMDYSKPDVVVHCAAITDVEYCQKHPFECNEANIGGTNNVRIATPKTSKLIYISSDMVYHGMGPHKEADAEELYPPVNVYGISKFHAEESASFHPNSLILRVNFYGYTKGLARWIIDSFEQKKRIGLYYDVLFNPLHVLTLSSMIRKLAEADVTGIYNLGSSSSMSKLGFGMAIATALGFPDAGIDAVKYEGIPRPLDMRMNVSKAEQFFGFMPTIQDDMKLLKGEYDAAVASRTARAV